MAPSTWINPCSMATVGFRRPSTIRSKLAASMRTTQSASSPSCSTAAVPRSSTTRQESIPSRSTRSNRKLPRTRPSRGSSARSPSCSKNARAWSLTVAPRSRRNLAPWPERHGDAGGPAPAGSLIAASRPATRPGAPLGIRAWVLPVSQSSGHPEGGFGCHGGGSGGAPVAYQQPRAYEEVGGHGGAPLRPPHRSRVTSRPRALRRVLNLGYDRCCGVCRQGVLRDPLIAGKPAFELRDHAILSDCDDRR